MENTNCLEGLRCPKCGHYDKFEIVADCVVTVTDEGTGSARDFEWTALSPITCTNCRSSGLVKDFMLHKPSFNELVKEGGEDCAVLLGIPEVLGVAVSIAVSSGENTSNKPCAVLLKKRNDVVADAVMFGAVMNTLSEVVNNTHKNYQDMLKEKNEIVDAGGQAANAINKTESSEWLAKHNEEEETNE